MPFDVQSIGAAAALLGGAAQRASDAATLANTKAAAADAAASAANTAASGANAYASEYHDVDADIRLIFSQMQAHIRFLEANMMKNVLGRVSSLDDTVFASGTVIHALGIPQYVKNPSAYSDYHITEEGWYVFARVTAKNAIVTDRTTVTGAAGYIATRRADHIDLAVRFSTLAEAQRVVIAWGDGSTETYVFRADDLANRNLDYRTTFYIYDILDYVTWSWELTKDAAFAAAKTYYTKDGDEYAPVTLLSCYVQSVAYALTTDETFQEGTTYYTKDGDEYTEAEVTVGEAVPANTYYVAYTVYAQTEDETFQEGVTYYTKDGDEYTEMDVTVGDPVPVHDGGSVPPVYFTHSYVLTEDETFVTGKTYYIRKDVYSAASVTTGETVDGDYYEHSYVLTADETFQAGKTYYTESSGTYTAAEVEAGDAVTPNTYYEDKYTLTEDETFQDGKTYYTKSLYAAATVTAGEPVTPGTYYESVYSMAEDETFQEGVEYYAYSGGAYTLAEATPGDSIPKVYYYVHTKATFAGMVPNVTYKLDETVDCPIEIVLPEVPEDGHGAWFEIQTRYNGSYSCMLLPPAGVVIGTAQTQAQTAGVNIIDLQYTEVDGVKMWTLLNTHSNLPA